jgi:hypothetical protein
MAKILVLGESGGGKTTSLGGNKKLGIKGADPKVSYVLSVTSKPISAGSDIKWPVAPNFGLHYTAAMLKDYRRIITNNPDLIVHAIKLLAQTPIENVFLDDSNYLMQDMYMAEALKTGWDMPKKIGFKMGKIFEAVEALPYSKNFIMMAHGEEYDKVGGKKGYRMKTTGKMVQEYVTPEGKFDILLIADSQWDETTKTGRKVFITRDDGVYTGAKCQGIFDDLYIPNDMGYVLDKVNAYYNSVEEDEEEPEATQEDTEATQE